MESGSRKKAPMARMTVGRPSMRKRIFHEAMLPLIWVMPLAEEIIVSHWGFRLVRSSANSLGERTAVSVGERGARDEDALTKGNLVFGVKVREVQRHTRAEAGLFTKLLGT